MQWVASARVRWFLTLFVQPERNRAQLFELLEMLSRLLYQGFPLQTALRWLADVQDKAHIEQLLNQLAAQIGSGLTLYSTLGPRLPALYMAVLRVGESSGNLWRALQLCAEHRKSVQSKREQIIRTASYPALLFVALGALVCTMSFVMVPSYRTMYETLGYTPPVESAVIFAVLERSPAAVGILVLGLTVCISILLLLHRFAPQLWQVLAPRLPFYKLLWTNRTEQFCQMLYLFVDSGVPVADAFAMLAEQGPRWLRARMNVANQQLLNGVPLSTCLGNEWHPWLRTGLHLSEGTGDLRWGLTRTAEQLKVELERRFRRRLKRLEPILLVIVGGVLTGVMLAVYVPMYGLAGNISSGQASSGGMTNAQTASQ